MDAAPNAATTAARMIITAAENGAEERRKT